MKRHLFQPKRALVALAAFAACFSLAAADLGPAFTFQGQLSDSGQPATGNYDLAFNLFDAESGGQKLGTTEILWAVPVVNGFFTVQLNEAEQFGPEAFNGQTRWIEVNVRTNLNVIGNNFVTLDPRQPLLAVPVAHYAVKAGRALLADEAAKATNADSSKSADWAADADHAVHAQMADQVSHAQTADTATTAQSVPWLGITDVLTGFGLGLGPNKELRVNFAGDGLAETAARSDHQHVGQQWIENLPGTGLTINNLNPSGISIHGKLDQYGSGFEPVSAGVFGNAATGPGVVGYSNTGPGVQGWTSALNIDAPAIVGENSSVTGSVIRGHAKAATGDAAGVLGRTESKTGIGVKGVTTATVNANAVAGWFEAASGTGVFGRALYGSAGAFSITNVNSQSDALKAETYGRGSAGTFQVINNQNSDDVVSAWGNGSGDTLSAAAAGNGNAGYFVAIGTGKGLDVSSSDGIGLDVRSTSQNAIHASTGTENAIQAIHTGSKAAVSGNSTSGRGVEGLSSTGKAVYGYAPNGTALYGRAQNGTALQIDGGAMRVTGAGVGTATAVFIHQCTAGNTPPAAGGNVYTVIDHPMCNGNPNAILFVTPRINGEKVQTYTTYEDIAVTYSGNRWWILNTSLLDELGDFDEGDQFNVMVILP